MSLKTAALRASKPACAHAVRDNLVVQETKQRGAKAKRGALSAGGRSANEGPPTGCWLHSELLAERALDDESPAPHSCGHLDARRPALRWGAPGTLSEHAAGGDGRGARLTRAFHPTTGGSMAV